MVRKVTLDLDDDEAVLRAAASAIGRRAGRASQAKLTPAERSRRGQELNEIRWAGHVAKRPASSRSKKPKRRA